MSEELILNRVEPQVNLQNGEWPKEIRMSLLFLRDAQPGYLFIGFSDLTFYLTNGRATYHIDRWENGALVCTLTDSEGPTKGG